MDLDPFEPVGINASTVAFLDVFLLHCLLSASPLDTPDEIAALASNQHRAAERGREPGLRLERGGAQVPLVEWGAQILAECGPIAAALDTARGGRQHHAALAAATAALGQPDQLPSARVLHAMRSDHAGSYTSFVNACAERTRQVLLQQPLSAESRAELARQAQASLQEQQRIEAANSLDFEAFREHYLSPQRLVV